MTELGHCCSVQLVNGDGEFNTVGLENFMRAAKLSDRGLSYAVVAIMGPQSSGKSTLLNHLFYTNFNVMDAEDGRNQTTKGIWMANCVGIEPLTIAMDLEGTDGRERGEDDTTFEKQSSLFALAIADVVLINMWCHDIGREQAANKPLLKIVFQVMMRLFSPRKTTLIFVIRDKTRTPLKKLETTLRGDIQKLWNSVPKPEAHKETPLTEFFNVEVVGLPSYEDKEEQFKEQVAELRQRFFNSTSPGGLAGDRQGVVPSSGFSFSAQQIWKVIKENKDLDLPAHKVMVATVRCEEIANEKFHRISSNEDWIALKEDVQSGPVSGFGRKMSSILETCFSEYDAEAFYFDEGVRNAKRKQLESKAFDVVRPAYLNLLGHLRFKALADFKSRLEQLLNKGEGFAASAHTCSMSCMLEFDKGCAGAAIKQTNWDASKAREELLHDIDAHTSSVRNAKLSELTANYEKQLTVALSEPVKSLLDDAGIDTWPSLRKLLAHETENAVSQFSTAISSLELNQPTIDKMVQGLKDYARNLVEKKAREEAKSVLKRMKDRCFNELTKCSAMLLPQGGCLVFDRKPQIKRIVYATSLRLLSVMAAIRLDDKPDKIESILFSSLMDGTVTSPDPLASSTWEEVSPNNTLITPVECKSLWERFEAETDLVIEVMLKGIDRPIGPPDVPFWQRIAETVMSIMVARALL